MSKKKIGRNEDVPFYFEKLLAGIGFLELLEKKTSLSRIQIKPDRKDGHLRRIEDFTKFYLDGSVEVFQVKHTEKKETYKFGFGDLWKTNSKQNTPKESGKKEGVDIFKFLKSWRIHKLKTDSVSLIILTNRKPTNTFANFIKDINKLRRGKLKWRIFSVKYTKQIESIKSNCSSKPFKNYIELKNFLCSLYYREVSGIDDLYQDISKKLKEAGVIDSDRIDAFIHRITKVFVSNNIDVLPSTVNEFINRLKTGLIQEIFTPPNYIERAELENKLLEAVESKKKKGGFVLLFAPSGSGKTILLSKLSEKNEDFFPYFCRIRPFEVVKSKTGYQNVNRLKSSWFKADIIRQCYEFGLLETLVGPNDDEAFIDQTFEQALSTLSEKALKRKNKKIVIIVDALDQIDTDKHKGSSVLDAIPSVNYPGVVFILSTWGSKYLPQSIKDASKNIKKEVPVELYFTEGEIKHYFQEVGIRLTQDQIVLTKKKTGGLAISLFYLSKRLKQQTNFDQIIDESSRYEDVLNWYKPIWEKLNTKERECLGCLCFHFARVSRENLRILMSKRMSIAEFNGLINSIQHFLDISGGSIEPYHDSFRRFVVSKLVADRKSYHQKLFIYYSKNTTLLYAKKYITKHLEIVGFTNSSVKTTFNKLHKFNFFQQILRSNLDDSTKVEVGKSFVNYFYTTKDANHLIQYSIISSNIYPTTYEDDLFQKAHIGGSKLLPEIENELLSSKGGQPWHQREWVFKRLSAGNILAKKDDKESLALAHRFIDDGLFRISLNRELLWDKDERNDFWDNVAEYAQALVNANQYKKAVAFYRNIAFRSPTSKSTGFRSKQLADVHTHNFRINMKETLDVLRRSPKIERLVTYLEMTKIGLDTQFVTDFKKLMRSEVNERYLYNDQQILDFAESLLIYRITNKNKRVLRLLKKIKIELPYWSDPGHISWGLSDTPGGGGVFLRWLILKKLTDKDFNLKDFYEKALKEKFPKDRDLSEYSNKHFIDLLSLECSLGVNRLLAKSQKIIWRKFWKEFENALKIYKEKIDKIKGNDHAYRSDGLKKECHPYSHNLASLLKENLQAIDRFFPQHIYFALNKIEEIFGMKYLSEREGALEDIVSMVSSQTPTVKEKIEGYLERAFEIRKSEKSDNMNKSSNLRDLAVLATQKGFQQMGNDIFESNLKYSRGLQNKEDLRFSNFVDAVRTQKSDQFGVVLKYIETISGVIEGEWYWRLDFLESVAYANYELALQYQYDFVVNGEVNHNESLRRVISTVSHHYPYSAHREILPLLNIMDVKDENTPELYENITKSYASVWEWCLSNKDFDLARQLIFEYIDRLNKDTEPSDRINLLNDIRVFLKSIAKLRSTDRYVQKILNTIDSEGYKAATRSSTEYKVSYDGLDIKRVKLAAKKGQIKAVVKALDNYTTNERSYFLDRFVVELVPILSLSHIETIRQWASNKNISIEGAELFAALIEKAAKNRNRLFLAKTIRELFKYINGDAREYNLAEVVRALHKIEFPNKKAIIKKVLLVSICRLTGSGYYLPQLFCYSSEHIDKYFPELKEFSYEPWKKIVEKSMHLSLSK